MYVSYTSILKKCFYEKKLLFLWLLPTSSPPSLLTLSKWNILNSVVYTYCLQFLCIFSMLRLHHLRIHSRKSPRSSHLTNLKVSPWFSEALVMKLFSWHRLLTSVIYTSLISLLIPFTPTPLPTPMLLLCNPKGWCSPNLTLDLVLSPLSLHCVPSPLKN